MTRKRARQLDERSAASEVAVRWDAVRAELRL